MAETGIDIPGLGHTKKSTLYAVGIGAVLIVGVVYYRSKKTAAAQAASVAAAGSNTIDPATGYPYGSPEDAAALATQTSYYQSGNGAYGGGYSGGSPGTGTGTGFVSNAAWAQAYEQYAVNNIQSDANTVAAALGKYLTGQPLTQGQLDVVEQAIAFEGLPPVAGPNGYPPSYQLQHITTPPPTGGGSGSVSGPPVGTTIYGPWLVKSGQSIQSVASRFGIQPSQIVGTWQVGNTVKIPWLVKSGQTWEGIAAVYGISVTSLKNYIGV